MITGTVYSVALNDRVALEKLAPTFAEPPYKAPPEAPVLAIKPRNCFGFRGAPIVIPEDADALEIAATIALLFARDCGPGDDPEVAIGTACLAIDVAVPGADYYRPAVQHRCRDGFLPLGEPVAWARGLANAMIVTRIDGMEAHAWSLDRLVRPIEALVRELASFMTLRAGDALLAGLPGDAPQARVGQIVEIHAAGFPALVTQVHAI